MGLRLPLVLILLMDDPFVLRREADRLRGTTCVLTFVGVRVLPPQVGPAAGATVAVACAPPAVRLLGRAVAAGDFARGAATGDFARFGAVAGDLARGCVAVEEGRELVLEGAVRGGGDFTTTDDGNLACSGAGADTEEPKLDRTFASRTGGALLALRLLPIGFCHLIATTAAS